jgi:glycolate oxidase FAD binding subunit
MTAMDDNVTQLQDLVSAAAANQRALRIVGGGSKDFYGAELEGEPISTQCLLGIVDYDPAELVLTARSGTALRDIEAVLAEHGQMLAFEPPHFGAASTLGGAIAAGLSGPRRAYAGAARDFVLGCKLIDGRGQWLRFGGQVIKNVAGFDVARLLTGSLGTLGILTEVTLKVLPRPVAEVTLVHAADVTTAIQRCNEWAGRPLPLSATAHLDGKLYVRLSGSEPALRAAREHIGGEPEPQGEAFWKALRDHTLPFFAGAAPLWRVSMPATTPALADVAQLIEWGGALRWFVEPRNAAAVAAQVAGQRGHVTLFRGKTRSSVFQPLAPNLLELHRRLKQAFDPKRIFNRGRLHTDL